MQANPDFGKSGVWVRTGTVGLMPPPLDTHNRSEAFARGMVPDGSYLGDGRGRGPRTTGGASLVEKFRAGSRRRVDPLTAKLERSRAVAAPARATPEGSPSSRRGAPSPPPKGLTRGMTPLPLLKQDVRKMAISLRSDGHAAMVPRLERQRSRGHYEDKNTDGTFNHRASLMRDKAEAVMSAVRHNISLNKAFHGVVDEVVYQSKRLPSIGTKVVAKLTRPFCGYRVEGIVRFVGPVPEMGGGIWVGLELFEPVGMHDGMNYFPCRRSPGSAGPYFGVFVRGSQIESADRVTAEMAKELGIRPLATRPYDLRSRKFWKDPFVAKEMPGFLRANKPNGEVFLPSIGACVSFAEPMSVQRGWHTSR